MSLGETLGSAGRLARLPFVLRGFMQQEMTLELSKQIIHERMAHRGENFLRVLKEGIFQNPRSPYLPLLKMAGCEFQDVCASVNQRGVEGTLEMLRRAGVYIAFEEFKGRTPIIRGSLNYTVTPDDFNNPFLTGVFTAESGGSSGKPSQIPMSLEQITARAPHTMIADDAYDLLASPIVVWRGIIPDSTLNLLLQSTQTGRQIKRWFSHLGLRDSKHWVKYGLTTFYIVAWVRFFGGRVPFPEFARPEQAHLVAQAVSEILAHDGHCMLRGTISNMLRVCLAAQDAGYDLHGLSIISAGEPCTPAKVTAIESTGARFYTSYAATELGTIGFGCAKRSEFDDVHVVKDAFALFTHPHRVEGFDITVPSVNITTLLPTSRKLFLNLELDDYAVVEERACGCPLEAYGYTTHLHHIRSYRKLTGEGVTLIGSDMVKILEETLPARFGGSPLDYQLCEQEDARGFTRLVLVIHPRVVIENEQQVIETVMRMLGESSAMADTARAVWQSADSLHIQRAQPTLTARGKLMPLHLQRNLPVENPGERRLDE